MRPARLERYKIRYERPLRRRPAPALRRRLGLPLLVLYGAGIYVLIGAVAGHAGRYAPWSFVLAAVAMAFTVGSYMELATRYPVSAGEAAYMRAAFGSRPASTLTGLLTIAIGIVSSATVALGAAGYIGDFIDVPQGIVVVAVVAALGLIAVWGILESVLLAGLFTLIEAGGLIAIIAAALYADVPFAAVIVEPPPRVAGRVNPLTGTPVIATALIAVATIALALFVPFERLAESTSLATPIVFALVNLALLRLRYKQVASQSPHAALGAYRRPCDLSGYDGGGCSRLAVRF